MRIDDLEKIGLSKSEATLYLALLKLGSSEVKSLVEESGFYKSNVYDSLERLYEKGIISKVVQKNKRVYQIQKPDSLTDYIIKKKFDLEEQEKIARKLAKNISSMKKQNYFKETAIVLSGLSGVKQIYSEIIENKLDYLGFGSPKIASEIIGDYYWENLHLKQKEFGIRAKMIFHKSLRNWKKLIPNELIELRFFDEKFEPLTETTIYGSKVAFVIWTEKPIVTIINNEYIAKSYRQIFDLLWKQARR